MLKHHIILFTLVDMYSRTAINAYGQASYYVSYHCHLRQTANSAPANTAPIIDWDDRFLIFFIFIVKK